jgi:hypothetical protein
MPRLLGGKKRLLAVQDENSGIKDKAYPFNKIIEFFDAKRINALTYEFNAMNYAKENKLVEMLDELKLNYKIYDIMTRFDRTEEKMEKKKKQNVKI